MPKKIAVKKKSWQPTDYLSRADVVGKILTLTYPMVDWDKMKKPMTLKDACNSMGLTYATFCNRRRQDPILERKFQEITESRRELMQHYAEDKIEKALTWELKLRPWDQVNTAFRLLEKTHKKYQPKQELEVKSIWIDISMTKEELLDRIQELSRNL